MGNGLARLLPSPSTCLIPSTTVEGEQVILRFILMHACIQCGMQACSDMLHDFFCCCCLFCFVLREKTSSLYWDRREDTSEGKLRI